MDAQKLFEQLQVDTKKNPNDIAVVLDSLITLILEKVQAGTPVDFGELGTFVQSEYGKLSFEVNSDFARLVNYKYETIQPVPIDESLETYAVTADSAESAAEVSEEISFDDSESPFTEVPAEEPMAEPVAEPVSEPVPLPVAEEPETIGFAEESVPELSEPEPVTWDEPAVQESDLAEPLPSAVIPEPEPSLSPEPFMAQEPEPASLPEPPAPSLVHQEVPAPASIPAADTGGPIRPPGFQASEPVSTPEPAAPKAFQAPPAATAEGNKKIDPTEYVLSPTELGSEMDHKKLWGLIALGILILVAAIWYFMSGDTAKKEEYLKSASDSVTATQPAKVTPPVTSQDLATAPVNTAHVKDQTTKTEPVKPAAKTPAEPVTTKPAPAQETKKPSSQPVKETKPKEPAPATKTAQAPAEKPAPKKPAAEPAGTTATHAGFQSPIDPAKGGFSINIGSFPTQAAADKLLGQWKAKGYEGIVQAADVNGKQVFRVRLGQFTSRAKALAGLEELKADIPDAWVDRLK
ncbi:MAG: SPOR domain-containing protein [Bacteroidetes bacterium]|nr:SPOR domain-containing protein [Bacteroidota bacterium]